MNDPSTAKLIDAGLMTWDGDRSYTITAKGEALIDSLLNEFESIREQYASAQKYFEGSEDKARLVVLMLASDAL